MRILLGQEVLADLPHPQDHQSMNWLLWCGACGEGWGRITFSKGRGWMGYPTRCWMHPADNHVAGSFFQPFTCWRDSHAEQERILAESPALLEYEFEVRMREWERANPLVGGAS